MKLNKFEWTIILSIFLLLTYGAINDQKSIDISDKLIRLHVIANSDTKEDQALKLKVRDNVILTCKPLIVSAQSKEEAREKLKKNMLTIVNNAQLEIYKNGYTYAVTGCISDNQFFETKYCDDFGLPSGNYEAVKINIGQSRGQNWWCVMYPHLCPSNTEHNTQSDSSMNDEEISFIEQKSPQYEIKFKTVEIVNNIRSMFR